MRIGDVMIVVAGAGIGGGLRYVLGHAIAIRLGTAFPWHTFAVNVSGAFLLGVLMALSIDRGTISDSWRLFACVGVLGGYTTFSTLAYESVALFEQGLTHAGVMNMLGSGIAGVAATVLDL